MAVPLVPLSILDVAPVAAGSSPAQALRNTLELVRRAEDWGYRRYWVAEHHNTPALAACSPPVLVAWLAGVTSSMRIGSGGVMLPNHSPLVVAEQFGTLEALHPGRIDLGIGRAPATDPVTAKALRRRDSSSPGDGYPDQIRELIAYFADGADAAGPVSAVPAPGNRPPVWLLGASEDSARLAGSLGLPYSFAHHLGADQVVAAVRAYRAAFHPSAQLDRPVVMVAASVVCADTDERAQWHAASGDLLFLRARAGNAGRFPSPQEAAEYPYTSNERQTIAQRMVKRIVGAPKTVREGVEKLLADTEADELMITTSVHGHADRLYSYELLAEILTR
jgi:luciferase family oxidoreductase group 1